MYHGYPSHFPFGMRPLEVAMLQSPGIAGRTLVVSFFGFFLGAADDKYVKSKEPGPS